MNRRRYLLLLALLSGLALAPSSKTGCPKLIYSVSQAGSFVARNLTDQEYPLSLALAYVDGEAALAAIVPALSPGDRIVLGQVKTPSTPWSWLVVSSIEPEYCYESGSWQ